jgi:hypothetical protein
MSLIRRTSRSLEEPHRRVRHLAGGAAGEKAERARDRGERRAKLMAHRGDEFVLQPFVLAPLADIEDDAEHQEAGADLDRIGTDLDREFGSVLARAEEIVVPERLRAGIIAAVNLPLWFGAQAMGYQDIDTLSDQVVAVIAEQALHL